MKYIRFTSIIVIHAVKSLTSTFLISCFLKPSLLSFYFHCRVLVIYSDGLIMLWDFRENKSIFTTGGNMLQPLNNEAKKVTSACWACPFGSKVVVGYNNGEIFIWSVPSAPNSRTELASESGTHNAPISKLNVGYKLHKIPIALLKWVYADGKASRLYVMGASNFESENLLQVYMDVMF